MNDRQRTEAIFFPIFFQQVLRCGVNDQTTEEFRACFLQLQQAIDMVLQGCDERRYANLMRRAIRLHNQVTAGYRKERVRVEKMGLIALYSLQMVLDADYLVLEEGSDLSEAINAIMRGLTDAFSEEKLDASAQKQAAKLLSHLQELGYFYGIKREAA